MTLDDSGASERLQAALVSLATEAWRFRRTYDRAVGKLGSDDQPRFVSQGRYFERKLDEALDSAGLRFDVCDGLTYEPGLAVNALNLADFESDSQLVIDQTFEPTILGPAGIVRLGTVTLRKADS